HASTCAADPPRRRRARAAATRNVGSRRFTPICDACPTSTWTSTTSSSSLSPATHCTATSLRRTASYSRSAAQWTIHRSSGWWAVRSRCLRFLTGGSLLLTACSAGGANPDTQVSNPETESPTPGTVAIEPVPCEELELAILTVAPTRAEL